MPRAGSEAQSCTLSWQAPVLISLFCQGMLTGHLQERLSPCEGVPNHSLIHTPAFMRRKMTSGRGTV